MKNKGKIVMTIAIGLSFFILSMVMFMQFKMVNEVDITAIENMREVELRTELANWKEKYEEVNQRYEEVVQMMEEYKDKEESDNETAELLQDEIDKINLLLGKTDVEGQGIIITLNEGDAEIQLTADNLLILVNNLKLAGAEAISINEERVVNTTDIVEINSTFIKVNGQRILAPYVIKVIGDSSYLESSLLGTGGYVEQLRTEGYDVTIEKKDKVEIGKYEDEMTIKYME